MEKEAEVRGKGSKVRKRTWAVRDSTVYIQEGQV